VSLGAAPAQPLVLVIAVVTEGNLAGAGVMIWRQIQYGRARLELDAPARRDDTMRGAITTSGSAWAATGHNVHATVTILAIRTYGGGRQSHSVVVARSSAHTSAAWDGKDSSWNATACSKGNALHARTTMCSGSITVKALSILLKARRVAEHRVLMIAMSTTRSWIRSAERAFAVSRTKVKPSA
jgi:hypothetical protein